MSLFKEFKTFAMRGNVIDLAVGVVIGAAFGKIVSSFVADVITPPLGLLVGGVDFQQLKIVLKDAAGAQPEVAIKYGTFIQSIFDFTIIAFCIFLLVKGINSLSKKPEPKAEPPPPPEVTLLSEIRDILKKETRTT